MIKYLKISYTVHGVHILKYGNRKTLLYMYINILSSYLYFLSILQKKI